MGHEAAGEHSPPQLKDLLTYLGEHPDATGLALGANGLEWERVPAILSADLAPYRPRVNPVGTTTLDLMTSEDRQVAMAAFGRCWRTGYAECTVAPIDDPEPHLLSMWDLRAELGTVIAVLIRGRSATNAHPSYVMPKPRFLVHTATESGLTLTVDDATERLLGWTEDDLRNRPRVDLVHPDDQASSIFAWVEMLERPGAMTRRRCRYRNKADDTWVWFEITNTNLLDSSGFVRCEMFDISDSMSAFDALYQREQLLRHLTESMPQGILHLSAAGDVLFANDHLSEIAGTEGDPFALFQQVPPEHRERLETAFARAVDGVDADLEGPIVRPDGSTRWCHARIRSLGTREAGVLVSVEDITDQWLEKTALAEQAATDPLTGLLNRRATLELLEQIQAEAGWSGMSTSVAFLDLDGFKQVNDGHGHQVGDQVLAAIARSLQTTIRPDDGLGRLGGDEFLVVCRNTSRDDLEVLARRLRSAVERSITIDGATVEITTSVGLATDRAGSLSVEALIDAADRDMYQEKHATATL